MTPTMRAPSDRVLCLNAATGEVQCAATVIGLRFDLHHRNVVHRDIDPPGSMRYYSDSQLADLAEPPSTERQKDPNHGPT